MKIINFNELPEYRIIKCPNDGFTSHRGLLKDDNMGYTVCKTVLKPTGRHYWHYKNHLESCYCVYGKAELTNATTGEKFLIEKDVMYVLDKNDPHYFEVFEECMLISIFNPPLTGKELHDKNGSY